MNHDLMTLPENTQKHTKWLQKRIEELIPIAAKTAFMIRDLSATHIDVFVPLNPNVNDKSTLFGGVSSMMLTLSGWALLSYHLKLNSMENNIVIAKSETKYTAPMKTSGAVIRLTLNPAEMKQFMERLNAGSRAKMVLKAELFDLNDKICSVQQSTFVALV